MYLAAVEELSALLSLYTEHGNSLVPYTTHTQVSVTHRDTETVSAATRYVADVRVGKGESPSTGLCTWTAVAECILAVDLARILVAPADDVGVRR